MSLEHRALLESYCAQDTIALEAVLDRASGWLEELHLEPARSISSVAWQTVRAQYPDELEPADLSWSRHQTIRSALYGGRTQGIRTRSPAATVTDASGCYPWIYSRTRLPRGEPMVMRGARAVRALDALRPGVWDVTVEELPHHLPTLPYRSRSGRISYPHGQIRGSWYTTELACALERGARIVELHRAVVWPSSSPVLREWVDRLWTARVRSSCPVKARWIKVLLNSLSGTWQARPYGSDVRFGLGSRARVCPCTTACARNRPCPCRGRCYPRCEGACGAHRLLNADLDAWETRWRRVSDRSNVGWGVAILSEARVRLLRYALEEPEREGADVVALSTDAVAGSIARRVDPPGTLGGWRVDGHLVDLQVTHPRFWSGADATTGELRVRASGHPARIATQLALGGVADVRRVLGLREALGTGAVWTARDEVRRVTVHLDGRGRPRLGDRLVRESGTTHPPHISDVE